MKDSKTIQEHLKEIGDIERQKREMECLFWKTKGKQQDEVAVVRESEKKELGKKVFLLQKKIELYKDYVAKLLFDENEDKLINVLKKYEGKAIGRQRERSILLDMSNVLQQSVPDMRAIHIGLGQGRIYIYISSGLTIYLSGITFDNENKMRVHEDEVQFCERYVFFPKDVRQIDKIAELIYNDCRLYKIDELELAKQRADLTRKYGVGATNSAYITSSLV